MKNLIIKTSEWAHSKECSLISSEDDTKCPLGFYLLSCGVKPEDMVDLRTPLFMDAKIPNEAIWIVAFGERMENSVDATKIMDTNDDPYISIETKKIILAEIFERHNVKVVYE